MIQPSAARKTEAVDADRLDRTLTISSLALLVVAATLVICGLALRGTMSGFVLTLGFVALIGALLLRAGVLLGRAWSRLHGRPARRRSLFSPTTYTCHACRYDLRGVEGVYCPECGAVRPAPILGDDSGE